MQKIYFKYILLFILLFYFKPISFGQIQINLTGAWDFTIPNNDIFEAGLDFSGTYSSNANEVTVSITQQGFFANFFNYNWRVDIRKLDIDWHSDIQLYARRTGNGNPFFLYGNIIGGTSYQQLNTSNQIFFSGNRSRLDIPIQYEIRNVSVLIPAKTYETTIIYTVTEL
ncbi:MAG: hypothetical protein NXI23_03255 [Bacteroidetes bacterium]|nr:hypothetical protein [Bacteroidota bacterium]